MKLRAGVAGYFGFLPALKTSCAGVLSRQVELGQEGGPWPALAMSLRYVREKILHSPGYAVKTHAEAFCSGSSSDSSGMVPVSSRDLPLDTTVGQERSAGSVRKHGAPFSLMLLDDKATALLNDCHMILELLLLNQLVLDATAALTQRLGHKLDEVLGDVVVGV